MTSAAGIIATTAFVGIGADKFPEQALNFEW